MIDAFCDERLDDEYAEICRYVAGKLARNRDCQVLRGKIPIWASGIVYAVGQIISSLIHRLNSISRLMISARILAQAKVLYHKKQR
jgi:hypothetical protein